MTWLLPVLQAIPRALFDWSALNTALILAAITYHYRQFNRHARMVDQLQQALCGMPGQKDAGALGELKLLRERSYEMVQKMSLLSMTVEELTHSIEDRKRRRD